MALFESLGVPLKTERGNRVFPVSDRSQSVLDALERFLREQHVHTMAAAATEIAVQDGRILVDLFYETYAESVINGAINVNVYVVG